MVDVRTSELPTDDTLSADAKLLAVNELTGTPQTVKTSDYLAPSRDSATQEEMEAGVVTEPRVMSPRDIKYAIDSLGYAPYMGPTPPTNPSVDRLWLRSTDGTLFWYDGSYWVEVVGAAGRDGADGQGVPPGGQAGQVLAKIDGTDFNTEWSTAAGGGGVSIDATPPTSPTDGQLWVDPETLRLYVSTGGVWVETVSSGGSVSAATAGDVPVVDVGTYYSATNVEDVLQELGAWVAWLQATAWTVVDARADVNVARPSGWGGVIWICDDSGNPANAVDPDLIIRQDLAVA